MENIIHSMPVGDHDCWEVVIELPITPPDPYCCNEDLGGGS
jgi:hypothetical protein